jgi:hypothetical protein
MPPPLVDELAGSIVVQPHGRAYLGWRGQAGVLVGLQSGPHCPSDDRNP